MDRGLKERLVGAAVLVTLGVWLIPWLLDGPGQTSRDESETLQLPLPADTTPLRSQTITLDSDREPPTPAVSRSEPDPEPTVATVAQNPVRDTSSSTPTPSAPADGLDVGWSVQVGSYAEEENAQRQAERVSSYGFDADVSSYISGGRSMQRVRIGPQVSRESAEEVASALSAHGFVAQVVFEE
jgi:DedD protein